MYLGISAEKPAATEAVDETAGEVLLYAGHVATTFFSSSTGGWTQSAADAFGGAGKPYLPSVRDPYDGISPYHDWGPVAVTAKTLSKSLGVSGRIVDATVARNASKRVKTLTVTSLSHGEQGTTSVPGSAATSAFALRSTWFSVGVLSLQPPSPNVPFASGTRVRLSGVARGVRGVVLQARSLGGPWRPLKSIVPAPKTGAFHLSVKPKVTTDYRLATAQDAAAYVRIRVT
jgi:stage II sporulation protein D